MDTDQSHDHLICYGETTKQDVMRSRIKLFEKEIFAAILTSLFVNLKPRHIFFSKNIFSTNVEYTDTEENSSCILCEKTAEKIQYYCNS